MAPKRPDGKPSGADPHPWVREFPATLTVIDKDGIIIDLTDLAEKGFAERGRTGLSGSPAKDCHPEWAWRKLRALVDSRGTSVYTYTKNGRKRLVFQSPWTVDGEYAGYLDLTLELPADMPHFDRDAK